MCLAGGETLLLHLVPFVEERFDAADFAAAGIACPDAISRSVRKRQAEFFHGRVAARAALSEFGIPALDVAVGSASEPIWPVQVVGSISHVNGLAGAMVGPRDRHVGLGIDLERTASGASQMALRDTVVNARELALLRTAIAALTLDELVTLVFSAKETLYKATYGIVGRFFGFEAARVEKVETARGVVTLAIAEDLHPEFQRGRHCEITFARLNEETFVTAFAANATLLDTQGFQIADGSPTPSGEQAQR
jgi:4'-phosphopantetheinyl transferase EntD